MLGPAQSLLGPAKLACLPLSQRGGKILGYASTEARPRQPPQPTDHAEAVLVGQWSISSGSALMLTCRCCCTGCHKRPGGGHGHCAGGPHARRAAGAAAGQRALHPRGHEPQVRPESCPPWGSCCLDAAGQPGCSIALSSGWASLAASPCAGIRACMCLWGACICSILPICVGTLASQGGWQPDFPQLLAWSSRAAQECGAQRGHHIEPCTPDRQHIQ